MCWSVSAAALRGASASMRVPPTLSGGVTEGETAEVRFRHYCERR